MTGKRLRSVLLLSFLSVARPCVARRAPSREADLVPSRLCSVDTGRAPGSLNQSTPAWSNSCPCRQVSPLLSDQGVRHSEPRAMISLGFSMFAARLPKS